MSHPSEHTLHASHLSVDQLATHLDRRLPGPEREAVVAHLAECGECRREYIAAGEIVRTTPRRRWVGALPGIGLAVAAVVVFAVVPHGLHRPETGGTQEVSAQRASIPDIAPPIRIAAPTEGERLTRAEVRLAWHPDGKEVLYRVTVQTAEGAVIWRTDTRDSSATLPPSVHLARGATYYWVVDALHADGQSARSPAAAFIR